MKEKFNKNFCYYNAERVVACGYKYSPQCPRVCKLFENEDFCDSHLEVKVK